MHGRTRQARYTHAADWDAIGEVAAAVPVPVVGNGDLLFQHEIAAALARSGCAGVMVARGALIKPWIFREFTDGDLDPTPEQRLAIYRRYVTLAIAHWGDDEYGLQRVREFLRIYNQEHRIVTMLTSHYMQDIEELCDRVIVIDHGRIFFDGALSAIIDRFSGHKIVSLTFAENQPRDFSAFGEVIEQSPASVQLKVPRAQVTEVCRRLLTVCSVSDINVQELPVEDVIRQLFGERSEEQRASREPQPA